jgi:hypothetical protein
MITTFSNQTYRITYQGISLIENALENPNLIQISVASECVIMVAPNKDYGIDYLPNGEYRSWKMTGVNTRLNRIEAHNIYARLSRSSNEALILFSINNYAIDGSKEPDGEASTQYYYIKIGSITATDSLTDATLDREITIDFGYLTTPAGQEGSITNTLFEITADDLIRPLKKFTSFIVQGTLNIIGRLVLNNKQISDVTRQADEEEFTASDESVPTTALLTGKYLDRLRNIFLNKDREDQTKFLLKFGEFIDSMVAGKGAGIFPDGRGQFEKLEVRSAMIVKELIYNRWFAQEGNVTYSEAGTIERIELLSDGTYDLYLRRRWDNDITAFKEQDVTYGSVNNLNSTGEYYDSWFRVLSVMQAENKINVVLYPDEEVPGGKNYEPAVGMVITRRGNAVDEERQGFWYISSYEGCICMLDGVTKPILEESNYSIIIGKLKRLELFDNLPINYQQSYVYCRGIAIQDLMRIDYQGVVVVQLNDRGYWSLEVAQSDTPYTAGKEMVDTVWHYGCRWKCLVTGTTDEPRYASTGWAMIEGNPEFTIDFESDNGWNVDDTQLGEGVVFTTFRMTGKLYNRDITEYVLDTDVTWTRDTGNVSEDNAWAIKRADAGKILTLTEDDLGIDFRKGVKCLFKCTAILRDGQDIQPAEVIKGFD